MNNKSKELIDVAKKYITESELNIAFAGVGGSAGRGDADEYSDIDLIIYTNDEVTGASDALYGNEIIQLDVMYAGELPNEQGITASPWDNRFLTEITIIKDTDNRLNQTKNSAIAYLSSIEGRVKMAKQVGQVVKDRELFALDSFHEDNLYSATYAAMGAWAEAAFLYLYLCEGSLSTGNLIPRIKKIWEHYTRFVNASPISLAENPADTLNTLTKFRKHLRKQNCLFKSCQSEIQDQLCKRKAQRLVNEEEKFNLLWQMYGEALWLYFETANGKSLESYFAGLPKELQRDLSKIGFKPIDEKQFKALCVLSDELVSLASENMK